MLNILKLIFVFFCLKQCFLFHKDDFLQLLASANQIVDDDMKMTWRSTQHSNPALSNAITPKHHTARKENALNALESVSRHLLIPRAIHSSRSVYTEIRVQKMIVGWSYARTIVVLLHNHSETPCARAHFLWITTNRALHGATKAQCSTYIFVPSFFT